MDRCRATSDSFPVNANDEPLDFSQLAICPFNRSHMMKKGRLQYHIVKCMKQYEGTKVPCPYNHTEYFEPENLISHLSVCPSRTRMEVHRHNSEMNRIKAIPQEKLHSAPIQNNNRYSDENWGFD